MVIDLAWTPSCSFVAAQPVEYRDHAPTPVAAPVVFEGPAAQALKDHVLALGE
ncbi:MAG: hypothetical protein KC492_00850 [Myxococcales bacterium]|nr:hypothetical protein [Myxococcales bacterium]MCB9610582.1 hypothetical protein [Polyangiaceae bacterium]